MERRLLLFYIVIVVRLLIHAAFYFCCCCYFQFCFRLLGDSWVFVLFFSFMNISDAWTERRSFVVAHFLRREIVWFRNFWKVHLNSIECFFLLFWVNLVFRLFFLNQKNDEVLVLFWVLYWKTRSKIWVCIY